MRRRYLAMPLPMVISGGIDPTAIRMNLIYPLTAQTAMVGFGVRISGTLTRSGSVAIAGLGAAQVNGLSFSALYTPVVGDIGTKTITVTATDASNGTTTTSSVDIVVVAAAVLPVGVTPFAFLRPDAPAFQDLAGTIPSLPGDPVRRVNNVSPLTGYWHTPAAPYDARKDPAGVRLEPTPDGVYPLQWVTGANATSLNTNNCTLVVSWVQRWQDHTMLFAGSPLWRAQINFATSNGGNVTLTSPLDNLAGPAQAGARCTMAYRFTPTGINAKFMRNGVVVGETTVPTSIASSTLNDPQYVLAQTQSYCYASQGTIVLVNSALSDANRDAVMAYADSIPAEPAYPLDRPLYVAAGDSNTVGFGASHYATPKFASLRALRAAWNMELAVTAISGALTPGQAARVIPFFDARRAKHVVSLASGTNDLATGTSGATLLTQYLAELDAMRAAGFKVIACTVQDRNGLFANGVDHASYRTQLDIFNAGVRAASAHWDALADFALIPQLGADGAANDTTYFIGDGVHLTSAGQTLEQAPMQAALEFCMGLAA